MRAGDIGDEAAGADSTDAAEQSPDLDAVRADDDLIEALSAGLVPPPSGWRDPSDVEGELVALLAGWVADIRPETLLHRPGPRAPVVGLWTPQAGQPVVEAADVDLPVTGIPNPRVPALQRPVRAGATDEAPHTDHEHPAADTVAEVPPVAEPTPGPRAPVSKRAHALARSTASPPAAPVDPAAEVPAVVALSVVRSPAPDGAHDPVEAADEPTQPIPLVRRRSHRLRPYLARVAAAAIAVGLVSSGVLVRSYEAKPGEQPLWTVSQMVFPAKSRSVAAASQVSTALNRARVALETGRLDEARAAYQDVQAQLAAVDEADGKNELTEQVHYLSAQLEHSPAGIAGISPATASTDASNTLAVGQVGAFIQSGPTTTPGATQALATTPASTTTVLAGSSTGSSTGTTPVDPSSSTGPVVTPPGGSSAPGASPDTRGATPPAGSTTTSSSSSGDPTSGGSTRSDPTDPTTTAEPTPQPPPPLTDPPTAEPSTSESAAPSSVVDSASTGGGDGGVVTPDDAASDSTSETLDPPTPDTGISGEAGSAVDGLSAVSSTDPS